MNTTGWALVSFAGVWGGLWSHPCEGRGMRKTINRTLGPAGFGTFQVIPVHGPSGNCRQQQESGGQSLGSWCRQALRAARGPLQTAPSAL